ncbi:MAG: transglutaminase domain-containing protein [Emergencia sp.]
MKENRKRLTRKILSVIVIAAVALTAVLSPAFADDRGTEYALQANRYAQNLKMTEECSKLNPELYLDKYLSEMVETRQTPLTEEEQKNIENLANQILRESKYYSYYMSDLDKLRAFHDWITEHFYYYGGEGVVQNPAQLYELYLRDDGRIRTWCNGYSAMLVAFARSQGIPATSVGGHYIRCMSATTEAKADASWLAESEKRPLTQKTHWWTIAYVWKDGKKQWVQIDCNADCYNSFSTGDWTSSLPSTKEKYGHVLFAPNLTTFSRSHIIWSIRKGSRDLKFMTDPDEKQQLLAFLEYEEDGISNGYRINGEQFDKTDVTTWFSADTKSETNGAEKLYRLYMPEYKGIAGSLDLTGFSALRNVKVSRNNVTGLNLIDCPDLVTVAAVNCNVQQAELNQSGKMTLMNLLGNPLVSAKYQYNGTRTAELTAEEGGTFQVKFYYNASGKPRHMLVAVPEKGYTFAGWYNGDKLVSKKTTFISTRASNFHYTARFVKTKTTKSTKKTS